VVVVLSKVLSKLGTCGEASARAAEASSADSKFRDGRGGDLGSCALLVGRVVKDRLPLIGLPTAVVSGEGAIALSTDNGELGAVVVCR